MSSDSLIQKATSMLGELKTLGGDDNTYIFSPFFKPINLQMETIFGALMNFPAWEQFSEEKVNGFKAIMNKYSDIVTGYIRIGEVVYQASEAHEYITLPKNKGRELIKALLSRAVKVRRFDLSMMNPAWAYDEEENELDFNQANDKDVEKHTMKESDDSGIEYNNPSEAVSAAMDMLRDETGEFETNQIQIDEMEAMIEGLEPFTINDAGTGILIRCVDNTGISLFNDDGKLWWEF